MAVTRADAKIDEVRTKRKNEDKKSRYPGLFRRCVNHPAFKGQSLTLHGWYRFLLLGCGRSPIRVRIPEAISTGRCKRSKDMVRCTGPSPGESRTRFGALRQSGQLGYRGDAPRHDVRTAAI